MDVKSRSELEAILKDFYEGDATVSKNAKTELMKYGEDLINAGQLKDYNELARICASIFAERGVDITHVERTVVDGRAKESSEVPAPIKLMIDLEKQYVDKVGELTEGAIEVRQSREIVEKLYRPITIQRKIIERIQNEPASIENFVAAINSNNELSQKQIAVENDRLKRFKEYFPDTDVVSTINPNGDTYKLSQYDKSHMADMQVQLLEDLAKTIEELNAIEKEREAFQETLTDPVNPESYAQENIDVCERKAKS